MSDAIRLIALLLVVLAVVNVYFVRDALRWYRSVLPPSPLLFALLGVKITIWLMGLFIGFIAFRLLVGWTPLPFGGLGVGLAVIALELLPVFIWFQMRRATREMTDRDQERDDTRDEVRDPARDTGRDAVRDPARDAARDLERDPARDSGRDAQ